MVYDLTYYNTIIDKFCLWYIELNTYLEMLPKYKISPEIHLAHIQRFVKVNDSALLSLSFAGVCQNVHVFTITILPSYIQYFQIRRATMRVYLVYVCFSDYLNSLFNQDHKSTINKLCFTRRYRPVYNLSWWKHVHTMYVYLYYTVNNKSSICCNNNNWLPLFMTMCKWMFTKVFFTM